MSATIAQTIHADDGRAIGLATVDTGARLSRALLSYLILLIAALTLLPFEFAIPETIDVTRRASPLSTLVAAVMFVPYGFLSRRAAVGRAGRHFASILLSGTTLSLALETVRVFEPSIDASFVRVIASVLGTGIGVQLCASISGERRGKVDAMHGLSLHLPLMGTVYLLLPLVWVSGANAAGEPKRLMLTLLLGLTGASMLGSVARAVRAYTPERPWWSVGLITAIWMLLGLAPSIAVDPRASLAIIAVAAVYSAWYGRWNAPQCTERRYEVPAVMNASPFLLLYLIGIGVWPFESMRTLPLVHLSVPMTEGGAAVVLPLLEVGIAATVMGYLLAELRGRNELGFSAALPAVVTQAIGVIAVVELARSVCGYEGASVARAGLSVLASMYGAWLYHLQRAHVKTVARRARRHG
jgi:hypothetical protein